MNEKENPTIVAVMTALFSQSHKDAIGAAYKPFGDLEEDLRMNGQQSTNLLLQLWNQQKSVPKELERAAD